jgi:hypothetical protein
MDLQTLINALPESTSIRGAAAAYSAEDLNTKLSDPEVVRTLKTFAEARGIHKVRAIIRLGELGLWKENAAPVKSGQEEPRKGKRKARPYSQGNPRPPEPKLVVEDLWDIEAKEVDWLWPGRFPLGAVSVILGRMGDGKSTFIGWLAATVAKGFGWPDCPHDNPAGHVLILQSEEQNSSSVRPRLESFGVDGPDLVSIVHGVDYGDEEPTGLSIQRNADLLAKHCEERGDVKLILFDPIKDYLGVGKNANDEADVMGALMPLRDLAERFNVAVVLIIHPRKDNEGDILDRAGGSGAFLRKARISWYLSYDPADHSRRLLTLMKENLEGATQTGLAFSYDRKRRHMTFASNPVAMNARRVDFLLQKQAREAKVRDVKPGRDPEEKPKIEAFVLEQLGRAPMLQSALQDSALNVGHKRSYFGSVLKEMAEADGRVVRERRGPQKRFWVWLAGTPEPFPPEASIDQPANAETADPPPADATPEPPEPGEVHPENPSC